MLWCHCNELTFMDAVMSLRWADLHRPCDVIDMRSQSPRAISPHKLLHLTYQQSHPKCQVTVRISSHKSRWIKVTKVKWIQAHHPRCKCQDLKSGWYINSIYKICKSQAHRATYTYAKAIHYIYVTLWSGHRLQVTKATLTVMFRAKHDNSYHIKVQVMSKVQVLLCHVFKS